LCEDEDGLCLKQKKVAAAYYTREGIVIDDDTALSVIPK
jgi:hypothetical protein